MAHAEEQTGELAGSVAIVTGAAGGVGRAVVALLRAAGANVVAEDLDPGVAELEEDPGVATVTGDVAEQATAAAAVAAAYDRFGRLDILVNNAARFLLKPTVDTTDEEWDGVMRTNVRGVFVHCREALPRIVDGGGGAVVNLASISGVVGLGDQAAYSASKGAIVQLTRQLAIDWSPRGVRVNAVAPGAIDTPFLRNAFAGAPDIGEVLKQIAAAHPLGRISEPEEIAEIVVFLASPRSRFVSGAILMADGGYTAQ
jgi:NAD(P)-dependent dehydrogenase (short-subunit alcohol dehydrogenase family)